MNLLWMDLEMTGLDENIHVILEIAAVVTNMNFETQGEFHRVIFQPPEKLAMMDAWCVKTHGESGLSAEIPNGATLEQAESDFLQMLDTHYKKDDKIVIAGNSISNDRRFIDRYLKQFAARLHYRMVDVSSFKEIFREKYKIQYHKTGKHRAISDINESIRELQSYLKYVVV